MTVSQGGEGWGTDEKRNEREREGEREMNWNRQEAHLVHIQCVGRTMEHIHVHECSVIETRQNKATMPKSFFPKRKEELPQAGLEPAMFCMLGRRSTN